MTLAGIEIPEAQISGFCRQQGIPKLALFGSVLSSRFSDSSDIDILIELRPDTHIGFFRLAEIEADLSRMMGGRKVDVRTPMDLSRHFREQVLHDALVLYCAP